MTESKVILTTISPNYVGHWTCREALREFIQNAIDIDLQTDCGFEMDWKDGKAIVRDFGEGLDLRHLAMGVSEKGDNAIGQFGEGLKLGMLVYSRFGRNLIVKTRGTVINPILLRHPDLGVEVMAFNISPDDQMADSVGVEIIADCSEEEYKWAANQFEATWFRHNDIKTVYDWDFDRDGTGMYGFNRIRLTLPSGRVFVNGQLVSERKTIFSWHIQDKKRLSLNRDRTVCDNSLLFAAVKEIAMSCNDQSIINKLADILFYKTGDPGVSERQNNVMEIEAYFYGGDEYKTCRSVPFWKKAITAKFGKKVVLNSIVHDSYDRQADWEGFTVIKCPGSWSDFFSEFIPRSDDVVKVSPSMETVALANIPLHERACFVSAVRAVNNCIFYSGVAVRPRLEINKNLFVAREIIKNGRRVNGICSYDGGGMVYIAKDVLGRKDRLCEVLLHEAAHYHTREGDCTSEFVRFIQAAAGEALSSRVRS